MHPQPDRREPDERTRYCPFCHLRIAPQEPQSSNHGQTFHEGCALKYTRLQQQSARLSLNAAERESGSREAALNSSSGDDRGLERATSSRSVQPPPSVKASATKMISNKKKAPTWKAISRNAVGKAMAKNPVKRPRGRAMSKGAPKRKTSNTKQQWRSP
jgi:hypothetical protein